MRAKNSFTTLQEISPNKKNPIKLTLKKNRKRKKNKKKEQSNTQIKINKIPKNKTKIIQKPHKAPID